MEALEVLLLLFLNSKLTVIAVTVSFLFSLNERPEKKPFIFISVLQIYGFYLYPQNIIHLFSVDYS